MENKYYSNMTIGNIRQEIENLTYRQNFAEKQIQKHKISFINKLNFLNMQLECENKLIELKNLRNKFYGYPIEMIKWHENKISN